MPTGERMATATAAGEAIELVTAKARWIRTETVRLAKVAGAGHYSSVFSAAELLAALYYRELRITPDQPDDPDRDRFVLSKGHAAIGLYPVLADLGFYPASALDDYAHLGSPFGDHPDMKRIAGVDFSSGSLGHGLSVGCGMALAGRIEKRPFRTWVMLGDGELAEGQVWEAAMAAGQWRLGRLRAVVDVNTMSIDGLTRDLMDPEPIEEKFRAFGWSTWRIDGHDPEAILSCFARLPDADPEVPCAVIAGTVKGRGVSRMELNPDWHVGSLGPEDYAAVMAELAAGSPR